MGLFRVSCDCHGEPERRAPTRVLVPRVQNAFESGFKAILRQSGAEDVRVGSGDEGECAQPERGESVAVTSGDLPDEAVQSQLRRWDLICP